DGASSGLRECPLHQRPLIGCTRHVGCEEWRPAAALCALQPCAPYLGDRNGSNSDIGRNPAVPLQIADATNWLSDVRFGSKADIRAAKCHVRFTPKADICGATRDVCFGPIADIQEFDSLC